MFQFSDTFITAQIIAGLFIACALLFSGLLKRSKWLMLGWACVVAIGVLMALITVMGGIETLVDPRALIFLLIPLGAVVLALIWASVLSQWPGDRVAGKGGRWIMPVLLALPALIGAGYFYQQQALPQTSCAQSHIPVSVAGMAFTLPLDFHADLSPEGQSGMIAYSPAPRDKEARKTLCDVINEGQQALALDLIWLAAISYLPDVKQACAAQGPAYCDSFHALDHARLGAVKIMTPSDTALRYELGQMRQPQSAKLQHAGDHQRGYVCQEQTGGLPLRHCRVWRTLEGGAVVLASGAKVETASFAELRAHTEREIDFVLQALAHRAP